MNLSPAMHRLAVVGLMLLWCATLIFYRLYRAFDGLGVALLWNLFLAVVPLVWSSAFQAATARGRSVWSGLFFLLWLLFLPNAPYLLTDLIHLAPRAHFGVPLWYVLAMLMFCAGTGTLLGYLSLITVHFVVERKFGKMAGWVVVSGSLMLCGFGIYLGRFLRWNSWDAFTHPLQLFKAVVGQFIDADPHPRPLDVTLIYGIGLIIGYLALRVIATAAHTD